MAEIDYEGLNGQVSTGHIIEGAGIRLDLYRLKCIFEASYSMALKCIDHFGCPTRGMMDDHETQEITRLVISISIFGRMLDDQLALLRKNKHLDKPEAWFKWLAEPVGELTPDLAKADTEPLDLRNAFNTVLHAKKMNFDVEECGSHANRYLRPYLYLYGSQYRKDWKVTLDVYAYIEKSYNLSLHVAI